MCGMCGGEWGDRVPAGGGQGQSRQTGRGLQSGEASRQSSLMDPQRREAEALRQQRKGLTPFGTGAAVVWECGANKGVKREQRHTAEGSSGVGGHKRLRCQARCTVDKQADGIGNGA